MSTFAEFSKACLPLANLFLVPYPHTQLAYDIIDGKVGDIFRRRITEETGLRVAAFWDVGFRHLISVKKPIDGLDSIRGMKFRVQPNPVHIAAFKLLNTNPTPISWGELFTSLQQGVVDGTENPLENVMSGRIYEVCKEMALTGHLYEFLIMFSNEQWYQNLPEDVRKEWDESLQVATETYRAQLAKKNSEWLDFFASKGMKITTLSPEELVKFREAVKPSQEETIKQVGQEYHDMIINEIAKTEKEYFEKHPELK
jgi:C4-dicarboxylate-binding protein DctP